MTINGNAEVKRPDDFIGFQGQFPVSFEYRADGPVMKHLDPTFDGTLEIVYFVAMPHVNGLEDEIPFKRVMFNKQLLQFLLYEAKPSLEKSLRIAIQHLLTKARRQYDSKRINDKKQLYVTEAAHEKRRETR